MAEIVPAKPKHKATYAADKKKGGWLVRVAGEYPEKFIGREVPVTMRDGTFHSEKLTKLIWQGVDSESGDRVALYGFEAKPREPEAELDF